MKTSNKILLGIFIAIILLTTTVQLMVYAKYNRGEYVKFQREEYSQVTKLSVQPFKFLSVAALGKCKIVVSDTPRLEVENYDKEKLPYRVVNDTLVIDGDPKNENTGDKRRPVNYQQIKIYLPATTLIRAAYSNIYFRGDTDSAKAPSYTVQLKKNTHFYIEGKSHNTAAYINELHITGESSNVELNENVTINNLTIQLIASQIDDKKASIQSMSIDADAKSSVNLSGTNIKALK
jgi:hypothetical protein